ncbi:MAG: outer membrane protein assembly factor BamD [Herminiimonas sp.]|nr:outer membrane protein assembly factor BamD [Herminiimonas sp.]
MLKKLFKLVPVAFALLVSACGLLPDKTDETANWSATKLYAEARDELAAGGYDKAIGYYEKLESRYPFGTYAQQAQMEIAYAHYKQADQPLALAAVERFIKLHPNHPNVDYMYYLRGLINFNDRLSPFDFLVPQDPSERDPKAAREAFDSFKQLVDRYPNSVYAKDSLARMKYLVNALAQHDVYVARYYFRRGAYLASVNRAQGVVRDYTDAPAIEEALFIMVRCYDVLGLPELRKDAERVLDKNYPNSRFSNGSGGVTKAWWRFW